MTTEINLWFSVRPTE